LKAALAGLTLFAATAALLWPVLRAASEGREPAFRLSLEGAVDRLRLRARLEPASLRERSRLLVDRVPVEAAFDEAGRLDHTAGPLPPGVHTVCIEARYGGGRTREGCAAALTGPRSSGALAQGAVRVFLPASTLGGLGPVAAARLRAAIAEKASFLKVHEALVRLEVEEGGIVATGRVTLADRSVLTAKVRVAARAEGTRLELWRRGATRVALRGPVARRIEGIGAWIGGAIGELLADAAGREIGRAIGAALARPAADAILRWAIERILDREVLPELAKALRLPAEVDLGQEWGGERLAIRYGGPPRFRAGQGIELVFDAGLSGGPSGPGGWLRLGDAPPPPSGEDLVVDVSADLANALLHALWARGRLRTLANEPGRLAAWDARLSDLTVRPASVDLASAPVVQPARGGLDLAVGGVDLRLVPRDGAGAALHGLLFFRFGLDVRWDPARRAIQVLGRPHDVALSCADGELLRPCFGDAVRIAREELERPEASLLDLLRLSLDRLNPLGASPGAEVVLDIDGVAPAIAGTWVRLSMRARFRDGRR
jgi:hypothetical protein